MHLVVDTISSMNHHDRNVGLQSMMLAGAQITTFQSLVFELLRDFYHPSFKQLMNVIRDMPKNSAGEIEHLDFQYF